MKSFAGGLHSLLMAVTLVLFVIENFMEFVVASTMKTASSFKTFVLIARLYWMRRTLITNFVDILCCHTL
jgi:hypothetical protein